MLKRFIAYMYLIWDQELVLENQFYMIELNRINLFWFNLGQL